MSDYSGAYIAYKGTINIIDANKDAYNKKLPFKNNAPSISCIKITNNTVINNAEDLNIVMPRYNLIEYSKNYSKPIGSLWNYCKDESNSGAVGDINHSIKDSKSFYYKTSNTGWLECNKTKKEVEIVVSLKHFSKFWKILNIPLTNGGINLILTWSKTC